MGGLAEVASEDAGKPRRMCRMAGAALVEAGPPSRAAHAERVPAGVPLSPATTRPAPGPLHRSGHERDRTGCANHPPVAVSRWGWTCSVKYLPDLYKPTPGEKCKRRVSVRASCLFPDDG